MATVKTKLSEQPPVNLAPRTTAEDVQQNMAMIFGTVRGTIPFMREFGVDAGFVDMRLTPEINNIVDEAYEQTEKYEPRATLTDVSLGDADVTGETDIYMQYDIKNDDGEEEDDE